MVALANLTTYISGESGAFLNSIEKTRGGLRSLISSLDPVAAATARYNRQVDMLDQGLKRNQITVQQHALAMDRLTQRYQGQIAGQQSVVGSTGQMRAGFQQLSFQMGDIATQFASGTKPMQIFAQQGSQVMMAIGMMQRESKGFIGFMAGPWGQVIMAAGLILSQLTGKLLENSEASKAAELANDGLSEAQSALGRMFDLTSGKLEKQNELLRLNALLTAQNLKAEAAAARSRVETVAKGAEFSTMDRVLSVLSRRGNMVAGAEQAGERISGVLQGVLKGTVDAERALKGVSRGDLGILGISRADFTSAVKDAVEARFKDSTAAEITKTLETGRLSDVFRQEAGAGRKERKARDKGIDQLGRFQNEIARMQDEHLSLLGQITTDVRERARLEHERLDADVEAYQKDLEVRVIQGEITGEQANQLMAARQANQIKERTLINWRLDEQLSAQELDMSRAEIELANDRLAAQMDAARTQGDRRRIQLQMLENDLKLYRLQQEAIIASHSATEAEKELARLRLSKLGELRADQTAAIERGTMGPMARYLDDLPKGAEELNEAYQRVAADGLQSLNDGLADAIMQSKSLGEVFKNVANQIIADLTRIAVQQMITKPLAESLFGGGSGGGFNFFGLFGGGKGGATPSGEWFRSGVPDYALPGAATGGEFRVGGLAGIDRNVLAINGIPKVRVSSDEKVTIHPANDRGASSGTPIVFDMRGAVMTQDLLAQMNVIAATNSAQVVGASMKRQARAGRMRLA